MNLQEAINALESAVKEVVRATLSDSMTPLGNVQAMREAASLFGTDESKFDVVVFGDLNRFKSLNDHFGHDTGDAAIGEVGKLIKKLIVEECQAQAFRRSGDEFVILLSNRLLEKFKARIVAFAPCSFQFEGELRKTGMSFGYAISKGEAGFDDLLARAETACQVAKSQANNDGVCVEWSKEIEQQVRDSLRDRCGDCGAWFTCSMPQQVVPQNRKLLRCPCCGESLLGDESPTQEIPS
jgi:diguanylate cyclase (GGDEF)-like protein